MDREAQKFNMSVNINKLLPWHETLAQLIAYGNLKTREAAEKVNKSIRTVQGALQNPKVKDLIEQLHEEKRNEIQNHGVNIVTETIRNTWSAVNEILQNKDVTAA